MKINIPHSLPFVGRREINACSRVISRKQLSQSREVVMLERKLSALAGHRYGAAVSSGTAALYLALRALGTGKNSAVVIPSYTCTALLNAVNFAGATPLLADVDPEIGNMTLKTVEKALRKNVCAVVVPHMFGFPADVAGIARLGVPVVEDCSQCVGAGINGRRVGGLSQVSIFSFYATKLIGAGEGGMVASSDRNIIDAVIASREYDNRETYTPGFNFKLSEINAAIARVQLEKLPAMIKKRLQLARHYRNALEGLHPSLRLPHEDSSATPVYFRFVVHCASSALRDTIIRKMDLAGIACRKPVFLPLHRYLGLRGFAGTDALYERALSLPLYPGMKKKDVEYIVRQLEIIVGAGKFRQRS